jgi:hypothetical protein
MADDFEKAVLITFNYGGSIEPSLKVCSGQGDFAGGSSVSTWRQGAKTSSSGSSSSAVALAGVVSCCLCWCHMLPMAPFLDLLFVQERATAYVANIKQSSDCWKLCVERFRSSLYPEVKFWCLQTLEEVG